MIGEIVIDAGGKRWRLFLGNAARCAVEEQYDKGFFAVVADAIPNVDPATAMAIADAMSNGAVLPAGVAEKAAAAMRGMRLSVLRDLAMHGLAKHHPEVTADDVSDIIDEIGDEAFGDIMGRAIRAAQPKGDGDTAAPGKPRRPSTRPRRQTGKG